MVGMKAALFILPKRHANASITTPFPLSTSLGRAGGAADEAGRVRRAARAAQAPPRLLLGTQSGRARADDRRLGGHRPDHRPPAEGEGHQEAHQKFINSSTRFWMMNQTVVPSLWRGRDHPVS